MYGFTVGIKWNNSCKTAFNFKTKKYLLLQPKCKSNSSCSLNGRMLIVITPYILSCDSVPSQESLQSSYSGTVKVCTLSPLISPPSHIPHLDLLLDCTFLTPLQFYTLFYLHSKWLHSALGSTHTFASRKVPNKSWAQLNHLFYSITQKYNLWWLDSG